MIKFKRNYKEAIFVCPNCGEWIMADLFKEKDMNNKKRTRLNQKNQMAKKQAMKSQGAEKRCFQ